MEIHYLPQEIWNQVCLRVPVRTLLRFKCVCKAWHSMIENPNFVSLHLSHCTNNRKGTHLIYVEDRDSIRDAPLLVLHKDTFRKTGQLCLPDLGSGSSKYQLRGYASGVMLLVECGANTSGAPISIGLLNPSIRKFIKLPPYATKVLDSESVGVGLGFDRSSNDYKVVIIGCRSAINAQVILAGVFSLNAGRWKTVGLDAGPKRWFMPWLWGFPFFFNGASHWLDGTSGSKQAYLISFDATAEVLSHVRIPPTDASREVSLAIFRNEYLAALDILHDSCWMWVMEEYGNANSWSKKYSIDIPSLWADTTCLRNGELLIRRRDKGYDFVQSYNFETQVQMVLKDVAHRLWFPGCYVNTYVESLVLAKN